MALPSDNVSMALYCDFENVALGVRDSKYNKFDIKPVLERLLLKGSIVVKKAYCDWDRYKEFKPQMHEASFELIEIPHVRQSGKNSADIRLVVDALDLCYTKSHVSAFVIISGDSDFSPLVSKLRENAKYVIGVGVKDSTSDLLIANCDEFIFIDDLLRESRRTASKREIRQPAAARPVAAEEAPRKEEMEARKAKAIDIAIETLDALMAERGENGKIWASTLKQAIKRRKPDFNETYFGFKTFGNLLEDAQGRGLIELGRDERSGAFVSRGSSARQEAAPAMVHVPPQATVPADRMPGEGMDAEMAKPDGNSAVALAVEEGSPEAVAKPPRARRSAGRNTSARKRPAPVPQEAAESAVPAVAEIQPDQAAATESATKRKSPARSRRRKPAGEEGASRANDKGQE